MREIGNKKKVTNQLKPISIVLLQKDSHFHRTAIRIRSDQIKWYYLLWDNFDRQSFCQKCFIVRPLATNGQWNARSSFAIFCDIFTSSQRMDKRPKRGLILILIIIVRTTRSRCSPTYFMFSRTILLFTSPSPMYLMYVCVRHTETHCDHKINPQLQNLYEWNEWIDRMDWFEKKISFRFWKHPKSSVGSIRDCSNSNFVVVTCYNGFGRDVSSLLQCTETRRTTIGISPRSKAETSASSSKRQCIAEPTAIADTTTSSCPDTIRKH